MIDANKHKLNSVTRISGLSLSAARFPDEYLQAHRRELAGRVGAAICDRYPADALADPGSADVELRHTVYVFSPNELAAFVSQIRDTAVAEVLAVGNELAEQQEKPNRE